jgi:hypothetical protein
MVDGQAVVWVDKYKTDERGSGSDEEQEQGAGREGREGWEWLDGDDGFGYTTSRSWGNVHNVALQLIAQRPN